MAELCHRDAEKEEGEPLPSLNQVIMVGGFINDPFTGD
jgi:hypothetical protein